MATQIEVNAILQRLPFSPLCAGTHRAPVRPRFRGSARAEVIRQDARLGNAVLVICDRRLKHQLQTDAAVQEQGPGDSDLDIHAWLESTARGKGDVLTAHRSGSTEPV
jgi:hypothetical protein